MLLYIYVSINALHFSVIRENIKGVFERLGFFFRIWMKFCYLSHYSFQISKAIDMDKFRKNLLSIMDTWDQCCGKCVFKMLE